jgi:hypothetical protein
MSSNGRCAPGTQEISSPRSWEANDIAVDQVAEMSKGLSKGREKRAGIEHNQRIEPFFDRPPEEPGAIRNAAP